MSDGTNSDPYPPPPSAAGYPPSPPGTFPGYGAPGYGPPAYPAPGYGPPAYPAPGYPGMPPAGMAPTGPWGSPPKKKGSPVLTAVLAVVALLILLFVGTAILVVANKKNSSVKAIDLVSNCVALKTSDGQVISADHKLASPEPKLTAKVILCPKAENEVSSYAFYDLPLTVIRSNAAKVPPTMAEMLVTCTKDNRRSGDYLSHTGRNPRIIGIVVGDEVLCVAVPQEHIVGGHPLPPLTFPTTTTTVAPPPPPTLRDATSSFAARYQVGTCFNYDDLLQVIDGRDMVPTIPCSALGAAYIYSADYRGFTAGPDVAYDLTTVHSLGTSLCRARLTDTARAHYGPARQFQSLNPSHTGWLDGDRSLVCIITPT